MSWIVAAFLMFLFAIPAYLFTRKAILGGMPLSIQNFASFFVPFLLFIPLAIGSNTSLLVSPYQLFIIVISALFFSYLGSKFSLLSIKYAPNPGYSLIISKSYVVFTLLVAVLFFQSALTFKAVIAIGLIVLFSPLIMIDPKATHSKDIRSNWLPLAFGAFFCWGMLAIFSKYLLEIGVPIYTRLLYIVGIVSAIIFFEMKKERVTVLSLSKQNKWLFLLIGICFTGFNYFQQLGYALAPNIGYINAINASSIAVVAIGSAIFFHDEFNIRKFIGVIGVIAGLILLVI